MLNEDDQKKKDAKETKTDIEWPKGISVLGHSSIWAHVLINRLWNVPLKTKL